MSDLLADARETLSDISSRRPGQTHYEGCRTAHVGCLLADLIVEVERLRGLLERQPFTPPEHTTPTERTVPTECTSLTDAERTWTDGDLFHR